MPKRNKKLIGAQKLTRRVEKRIQKFEAYYEAKIAECNDDDKRDELKFKLSQFKADQLLGFPVATQTKVEVPKKFYPPIRKPIRRPSQWITFVQGGKTGLKK